MNTLGFASAGHYFECQQLNNPVLVIATVPCNRYIMKLMKRKCKRT